MKPSYHKILKNLIKKNKLEDIKIVVNKLDRARLKCINLSPAYKISLLEYALLKNRVEIFEYLVDYIDINRSYCNHNNCIVHNREGHSLLIRILLSKKPEELESYHIPLIIKHTNNLNIDIEGTTYLLYATKMYTSIQFNSNKHEYISVCSDIITELLDRGADPDLGVYGRPIHEVISYGSLELLDLFIKHSKCDISSAIYPAIRHDKYDMVELLINKTKFTTSGSNIVKYAKTMTPPNNDIIELLETFFKN